jgi:2-desacetyl-2-hydroxyethyl bacteriochlorophyllide A dehydrogenase
MLVRNLFSGICGTDRHVYHTGHWVSKEKDSLNYPAILGHEGSAEIVELGEGVHYDGAGQSIKVGDMVAYRDILECGTCRFCLQGLTNICSNMIPSALKPGTFSEYFTYPSRLFVRVDGITPLQGSLIEPGGVALHGSRRGEVKIGDTVLIIGAGPISLMRLQFVRYQGATQIIVSEPSEKRRALAKKLGADVVLNPLTDNVVEEVRSRTSTYGADVVFEDSGRPESVLLAVEAARPRANIVLTGIGNEPLTIDYVPRVMLLEMSLMGSCAYSMWPGRSHDYVVVADMIRSGQLQVDDILTKSFPLEDFQQAFDLADDPEAALKVTIDMTGGVG